MCECVLNMSFRNIENIIISFDAEMSARPI